MALERLLKSISSRKFVSASALALSLYSLPFMTSCSGSNDDSDQYGSSGDVNNWSNGDNDDDSDDGNNEGLGICNPLYLFCDDFEGDELDPLIWDGDEQYLDVNDSYVTFENNGTKDLHLRRTEEIENLDETDFYMEYSFRFDRNHVFHGAMMFETANGDVYLGGSPHYITVTN